MNGKTQETIQVYRHIDNCINEHCINCSKCLKCKVYEKDGYNYCKKCLKSQINAEKRRENVHINKATQYWIDRLTDLFCLDHTPTILLKRRDTHRFRGSCLGRCYWTCTPIVIEIWLDHNGNFELSTLVHEFLHATGYNHKWQINGWANFGYGRGRDRDRFSMLIVRDLTGKDELIL